MNLRILFIAAASVLLSACVTLQPEVTFERLSLVREAPPDVQQLPEWEVPKHSFIGMLRLDFTADADFIKLSEDDDYNTMFEAETCKSKVWIANWPDIFKNGTIPLESQKKIHHYSVFLHTTGQGQDYDLKRRPESLCFVFSAGRMFAFFNYHSNILVVDREQVIRAFEPEQ